MSDSENQEVIDCADKWVRAHKKEFVEEITKNFSPEQSPASIFMAGSPGAGKTEVSKSVLKNVSNTLRIDADELRDCFKECGYTGDNSHLFQKAATRLVHEMHDFALKKKISFLLDGTFSNETIARQNIQRSLKRGRSVYIIFVYQSPHIAWNFVQKREKVEGRRVRAQDFSDKFCASQIVVNKIKAEFADEIVLLLHHKDIDTKRMVFRKVTRSLDEHIPEKHTAEQLLQQIQTLA